jgi:hypothetical protein
MYLKEKKKCLLEKIKNKNINQFFDFEKTNTKKYEHFLSTQLNIPHTTT